MGNIVLKAALEYEHIPYSDREVISMEEEMMAETQSADLMRSVGENMNEINRVTEVSQSLLDMTVVAQTIKEATPAELALMEINGDMACAGTDIPSEVIVPQLESYLGKQISIEDMKNTANSLWENIQKIIRKIWDGIKEFFKRIYSKILPNLSKKLDNLKDEIKELNNSAKKLKPNAKVNADSAYLHLVFKNKFCKNGKELDKALEETEEAAKYVFDKYAEVVLRRGRAAEDVFNRFRSVDLDQEIGRFRYAHQDYEISTLVSMMAGIEFPTCGKKNDAGKDSVYNQYSTDILGNSSLSIMVICNYNELRKSVKHPDHTIDRLEPLSDAANKNHLWLLRNLGKEHVELVDSFPSESTEHRNSEIEALSVSDMEGLIGRMRNIMQLIGRFEKGTYEKMLKQQKDIESSTGKLIKDKSIKDEKYDDLRNLANFNMYYAHWVESPSMKLVRSITQSIRALTYVIEKSIALYE